jgi:hypothetical protein
MYNKITLLDKIKIELILLHKPELISIFPDNVIYYPRWVLLFNYLWNENGV